MKNATEQKCKIRLVELFFLFFSVCQLSSTSSNLTGHEKVSHFSISSSEGIKNPSTTSEISQVQSVVWIGQGTKAMDPQSQFIKLIPIVL